MSEKRLTWDKYFLLIAGAVGKRSTCLRRKYGAVLVDDNHRIVSTGYNGSRCGEDNCLDLDYCIREKLNVEHGTRYELCKSVHAEMNAIISADPNRTSNGTLYIYGEDINSNVVESSPCLLCQRVIANAHIKRVVFLNNKQDIVGYLVNPKEDKLFYIVSLKLFFDKEHFVIKTLGTDTCCTENEAMSYFSKLCNSKTENLYNLMDTKFNEKDKELNINLFNIKEVSKKEYDSCDILIL